MADPTIVLASLDDEKLKQSIANLVAHVKRATHTMLTDTNSTVDAMEEKLKSLGNLKIDSGGSADGGASKRTKAQNADTDAVEKNIAARDKQIKKNQETAMSFDQMANAQQKAVSGGRMGIMETYNMQIELFKNRLREVRQDIDIFNAAIGSGKKTQIEWGQQGLKQANAEAEKLMRIITTLENQRGNLANILAPQGHTIQNYVNSLQKANPELAQLNDSFKRGQSLMQNGITTTQQLANAQGELNTNTNVSKKTLDEMNAYIRQNIQREQERRDAIRQTGLAAQQSYRSLVQSAREQLEINTGEPIKGVKELGRAIIEMRRAYYDMSDAERLSPIGQSLFNDIKKAEELRKNLDAFNRNVTGISFRGANNTVDVDKSIGSYANLSKLLKELTSEYQKLGREERNAAKGNELADKIQRIGREAQKAQQQMNRPISFAAAMKGDEKTLDDIAYKMQRLRSYRQGIDLTKPNAANEIKQVDEALAKLQKDADKWMSKSQQMIKSNTALGRSWNYMKNRLAFYFTVGASTSFIKNLIEVRSQYEMNERALGILIDSAERGTQIFNELSQMALVSPYTLIELSTAAKQLTAYDVAAKDVVDTTRRLADMASAVGIPIERLTYALGQIKAYGYLNSRDARMFANAGIPLVKQLADYYTELEGKLVSTADIYDRIKKKTIGYNDVMSVMYKMTDEGGKFFDFQAKMADTLKVRLANLTLAWNNMLNDMGKESQGVLTWGIGALRELFLQWRTFDKTLKEAAGAFGLYKAIQLIILGLQTATKSTLGLNARLTATGVLGTRLVTIFKSLGSAMKSLAANWWLILVAAAVELSSAIINANEATKEFNKSMREGAESTANDLKKYIEQYKELRDSLYKTQTQTLPNGKTKSTLVPQDIDKNEASKAWETMREQIELSSAASNDFVSRLLQIENVSDRLREGFKIIDDITQVNAALKDMGDEALVVTQKWSAWWNAWQAPDGLFTNLKEFKVELDEIRQKYGDIANARYVAEHGDTNRAANEQDAIMRAASEAVNDYDREMNRFRVDLDKYTSSLDNFANAMEFSSNPTQVAELYAKAVKQLVTQGQLNPQEAFDLQLQIEEARTNAMKLALQSRIADEESALKLAQDERTKESLNASIESNKAQLKLFENSTYEQTAYWNDFTKYIKERHISELSAAYNAMTDNGKKEMDFQSSEWQKYVHKWANSYEKSHNLATDSVFNRIKNWINDANTWSIFIKMTISTEDKKSVYDQLGEYDKAIDDADAKIARLTTRINELNAKKKKSKEETQELANAEQEVADAQKAKADTEAKGGHGKKEKKDEKAANKAAKQAETELQKALKDELSTIEKVRSIYKDLTKEGMSHANAVERATKGWDETINAINRVLQKNGLQKLDLSKFAGIENPRELVNMLQSQLNTLLKRGAKPAEIKELQTKVNTLEVDADKYDLTKITKGLNNELGKLKDEYELAVELDANPEMGNMFTEMFGLDTSDFPKTIDEYMQRVQQEFDKMRKKRGFAEPLEIFKADDAKWESWGRNMGLVVDVLDENGNVIDKNTDALDKLTPKFKEAQGVAKKWAQDTIKATQDLEYKLGDLAKKVEIEEAKLAVLEDDAANNTNAAQKRLLKLRIQEQKEAIEKLKMESVKLLPFYEDLFGDMYNVSVGRLKEIAKAAKEVMTPRQGDSGVGYTQRTDSKGKVVYDIFAKDKQGKIKKTTVSLEEYIKINKQIDSVQQKIAESSPWEKIKDSFSKKEGGGLKNFASGMETIGGELQKVANITKEIGGFAEALGADENTVEIINDIATSIGGVATAAQGIGQIASGDYIGGAASVLSGAFSAISSWFDNADKEIVAKIKDSEREVKKLENSYKNLEYAIEQAYGMAEYGARRAAIANRQLQLVELQRQLRLEQSRDSKHRDEDRILELKGQIIDLRNEISKSIDDITNDMLGISSVGNAAEELVSSMIDAFRQGEDYMLKYDESFEKMIDNMIMKAIVSRVVGERIEQMWNQVKATAEQRGASDQKRIEELTKKLAQAQDRQMSAQASYDESYNGGWAEFITNIRKKNLNIANAEAERIKTELAKAEKDYAKAIEPTKDDVDNMREMAAGWREDVKNEFEYWMGAFGIGFGEDNDKQLSALQQGISGITEQQAGALEAYWNSNTQQQFLHSDLLTQIRDTMVGWDFDVQTATMGEILLQLRSSYEVQMAIHGILEGVLNPSGRAFNVELLS
jgi:chromosome segregation ATPase